MSQSFQTLLEGIYGSILEARRHIDTQHLELFESYFDSSIVTDPATGERIKAYAPRMIAVATTRAGRTEVVQAPVAVLIPQSGLAIETLEIEFETKLANLNFDTDEVRPAPEAAAAEAAAPEAKTAAKSRRKAAKAPEPDDAGEDDDLGVITRTISDFLSPRGDVQIMMKGPDFDSAVSPAKVKVTFRMQPPPEGAALIYEELLKYLRS